jgi:hypothetical protein
MTYSDWLPRLAPPWLCGPNGAAYLEAIGQQWDAIATRTREAIKARLPRDATGEKLDEIGKDRSMPRGPSESDASYAARLADAWTAWGGSDAEPTAGGRGIGGSSDGGGGGTHLGLLRALAAAGFPVGDDGCTIVQQNGRYSQLVDGDLFIGDLQDCVNRTDLTGAVNSRPGWQFEMRDNFYSLFGIIIPVPQVAYVDPALLNSVVDLWKPAKTVYMGCWIRAAYAWPGAGQWGWPTTQQWGDVGLVWGGSITYLAPSTRNATTGEITVDGMVSYNP